nr:hypothetical protein [Tanacetum cinerariifolium]
LGIWDAAGGGSVWAGGFPAGLDALRCHLAELSGRRGGRCGDAGLGRGPYAISRVGGAAPHGGRAGCHAAGRRFVWVSGADVCHAHA